MEQGELGRGFGVVTGFLAFREVMWVMRMSNFCQVFTSQACNSGRACSRTIQSFSMVSKGMVSGNCFPKMSEEESSAGKYTECNKLVPGVLGARNATMVNLTGSDWSSRVILF